MIQNDEQLKITQQKIEQLEETLSGTTDKTDLLVNTARLQLEMLVSELKIEVNDYKRNRNV